ncbi:stage II sporulation protein M [Lignipirellula cremea]|uniref:Stage II sporulation protein M n=1 Tax=Lignipirellula cremea TaxID=2528010 RepID=A0A518DX99_9BACT|nr:stage II sporulation protein M [Lignipirellula cremea]QDU96450.1 hypothetical protein Pla8534_42710 [Lignipirellula cremea]
MKVAELLKRRQTNWRELEQLQLELQDLKGKLPPERIARFASLYRSTCADLALAEAHNLPPGTVDYLHRLVARCHSQLYRSRPFDIKRWSEILLVDAPQIIFNDRCVQIAFCLFWGVFILAAWLAYDNKTWPRFADELLTPAAQTQMHDSFKNDITGRDAYTNLEMAAFYIAHNTGIGIKCFVTGLLVVPGLYTTIFNAASLGASFGFMARDEIARPNFFHFVTAHGPFELTAICLAAGAGLRLGVSWMIPRSTRPGWLGLFPEETGEPGLTRLASLQLAAKSSLPVVGASVVLFFLAALTEGFLSPSAAPYWSKALFAVLSSGMLMFYFVVLGFPRGGSSNAA